MAIYQNPFAIFYFLFKSFLNKECASYDSEKSTTLNES